jgi:small subunit ribosomal protein S6
MFLVDAGRDFGNASEPIKTVLGRAEAEVLSMKPWDERRLAYEINGRKRGLYVLTYFKADPANMAELERDVQLNEDILRMQVLRREDISEDELSAETPATEAIQRREESAEAPAEQDQTTAEGGEEETEEKSEETTEAPSGETPAEASEETPEQPAAEAETAEASEGETASEQEEEKTAE